MKNLKIYEKNLVESKEIDYEPILKIYNFYSCVYLLNYIHTERTLKDQRIKIIAYLKSGETYVAKQASLITSIGQSELLDQKKGRKVKMSCGAIYLRSKMPQIYLNGLPVNEKDVVAMVENM